MFYSIYENKIKKKKLVIKLSQREIEIKLEFQRINFKY